MVVVERRADITQIAISSTMIWRKGCDTEVAGSSPVETSLFAFCSAIKTSVLVEVSLSDAPRTVTHGDGTSLKWSIVLQHLLHPLVGVATPASLWLRLGCKKLTGLSLPPPSVC